MMISVLILCTANSSRSQMAEGILREIGDDRLLVRSAGHEPSHVNPLAIQAMTERGIDISQHRSKHLNEFLEMEWDYVITVCDNANETCPVFPGEAKRIHWSFPDPAAATGSEAERLAVFRKVRGDLEATLSAWVTTLGK